MHKKYLGLVLLLFIQAGFCKAQQKDESAQSKTYSFKIIGWEYTPPSGWPVMSNEDFSRMLDKGLDTISRVTNGKLQISRVTNLITVKKDQANSIAATVEPFDNKTYSWAISMQLTDSAVTSVYKSMNLNIDTASAVSMIDGLAFNSFHVRIFSLRHDVIFEQTYYMRLIDGYSVGIILTYNNDEDKNTMLNALMHSKFKDRD